MITFPLNPSIKISTRSSIGIFSIVQCIKKLSPSPWSPPFWCNDITNIPELFVDAVNGKFRDCDRWVGREEFLLFKDVDPFVAVVYSFGNDCKTYMYSREIEPYKRAIHRLLFAPTVNERRLAFRKAIVELKKIEGDTRLQSLESLERLQSLESLESLQRLEVLRGDYREVKIKSDSLIYCDIPYKGTAEYTGGFNHSEFYKWCGMQKELVIISEYAMPEEFVCVAEFSKRQLLSSGAGKEIKEKLFIPEHQLDLWQQTKPRSYKQLEFNFG